MNKTIDWDTHKFHCSGLPHLMTNSRSKGDILSETAKSYLRDVYVQEVFGRTKIEMIGNKYTKKGIECETDTIELISRVTGKTYFKNNEELFNDYIVGTPDITKPDLIDVKTSWNLHTFAAVDEKKAMKDYFWQMVGYMWLTDNIKSDLIYGLVNTPEDSIKYALYQLSFSIPEDLTEQYRNNFVFDDIPEEIRIKRFPISMEDQSIDLITERIIAAREYMKTLSL